MSTVKEWKQYYYYRIHESGDLSESTFLRRQKKLNQSNDLGFLFALSSASELLPTAIEFIRSKVQPKDTLLLPVGVAIDIETISPQFIEHFKSTIFFKIENLKDFERAKFFFKNGNIHFVIQASNKKECLDILSHARLVDHILPRISLLPLSYSPQQGRTASAVDYFEIVKNQTIQKIGRHYQIPLWNGDAPTHYELEPLVNLKWQTQTIKTGEIYVSVIIPTFNNAKFLVNVLAHLAVQNMDACTYEIIIVDDGSTDATSEIVKKYIESHKIKINLKYIYWDKQDLGRGPQNFFRPGHARNLGANYSDGNFLVFLDSDMLVPDNFISMCIEELNQNDLIQFQRYHIQQALSATNPKIENISTSKDCYVEEKHYWNQLFKCQDWNQLPTKWKFVCTYALGVRAEDFFVFGRIKRHFISYGFEDTDLGYRYARSDKKFKLVKMPLMHLTNYSQMQYQNSAFKRQQLLGVTAKMFFLDHLDIEIGTTLRSFLGGEKGLVDYIKARFE